MGIKESKRHLHARHYAARHITGPMRSLNPTRRHTPVDGHDEVSPGRTPAHPSLPMHPWAVHVWRARDNRKGRHAVAVDPDFYQHEQTMSPEPTNTWRQALLGMWKMLVTYPVWDVSYDVAVVFTIGSLIWVINGFFVMLPVVSPSSAFPGESAWGGGWSALIGATVFEIGSVLLMLEAVNENRTDCFGWALEESADGVRHLRRQHHRNCRHHHAQKRYLVSPKPPSPSGHVLGDGRHDRRAASQQEEGPADWESRTWSWWPTWYELRTHYIREIGFLACSFQMAGATIFWISGFTALPDIDKHFSRTAENCAYWLPQVLGGTGFIVSSLLFMIEVQPRWYIAAPGVLGWHVGFWNLIGAVGFTLCGALGMGGTREAIQYALTLSTFIGSWAFLIGSGIQWFESLDKYPLWIGDEGRQLGDFSKEPTGA